MLGKEGGDVARQQGGAGPVRGPGSARWVMERPGGWHSMCGPCGGSARWAVCQAPSTRQQEECHLLEQCRGLDKAVVQLTEFVQQNQVSLNRVLLAEQKAWWVSEWALRQGRCPPSMVPQGRGAAL